MKIIDIHDYQYTLKDKQIAKFPVSPRDTSNLLFYHQSDIQHLKFRQIAGCLPANAHLVLNNTRVIPARLHFRRKTGAVIEVFLLKPLDHDGVIPLAMAQTGSSVWECVIGNKKKWKEDEVLSSTVAYKGENITLTAQWKDKESNTVRLEWEGAVQFSELVELAGNMPLPPYLHRESEDSDKADYQTIYSEKNGAVAAPTAGLHFTESVFNALEQKGIQKSFVTLHVGAGTFLPVKEKNALDHPMHSEQVIITRLFVKDLLDNCSFIVPVGTTSMRSLESLYWVGVKLINEEENYRFVEKLYPYRQHPEISLEAALKAVLSHLNHSGDEFLVINTEIMIFPGYHFKVCKGLITNFHQPASTLLLLVAAFVGEGAWKKIYTEAGKAGYRFLSYGDSSLLIP